jgi:flavodoxin
VRVYFFVLVLLCSSLSCAFADANENATAKNNKATAAAPKVVIVYLSRTNNTKTVAEFIQQAVGGELVAIELQTPYPENYQDTVEQVRQENQAGYLPALKTMIKNIASYDVIFLGFPTWGMQMPPPVKSFLAKHQLGDKTVIPFNTNAGYGIGSGLSDLTRYCPDCRVLSELQLKGGIERDGVLFVMEGAYAVSVKEKVQQWLRTLSVNNEQIKGLLQHQSAKEAAL